MFDRVGATSAAGGHVAEDFPRGEAYNGRRRGTRGEYGRRAAKRGVTRTVTTASLRDSALRRCPGGPLWLSVVLHAPAEGSATVTISPRDGPSGQLRSCLS